LSQRKRTHDNTGRSGGPCGAARGVPRRRSAHCRPAPPEALFRPRGIRNGHSPIRQLSTWTKVGISESTCPGWR
jgi:hypothetical protein